MKVTTEIIYKCDICGKTQPWIIGKWIAHIFGFGPKNLSFEHEFHVCSDECDTKLLALTKDQRKNLAIYGHLTS